MTEYPQAERNALADAYAAMCSAAWACTDARRGVALSSLGPREQIRLAKVKLAAAEVIRDRAKVCYLEALRTFRDAETAYYAAGGT